jgi:hypothetical protein
MYSTEHVQYGFGGPKDDVRSSKKRRKTKSKGKRKEKKKRVVIKSKKQALQLLKAIKQDRQYAAKSIPLPKEFKPSYSHEKQTIPVQRYEQVDKPVIHDFGTSIGIDYGKYKFNLSKDYVDKEVEKRLKEATQKGIDIGIGAERDARAVQTYIKQHGLKAAREYFEPGAFKDALKMHKKYREEYAEDESELEEEPETTRTPEPIVERRKYTANYTPMRASRRAQLPKKRMGGSNIASMLFKKNLWTKSEAARWLRDHRMKHGKVDITDQYIRFRQHNPKSYKRIRTKKIPQSGITLLIGFN